MFAVTASGGLRASGSNASFVLGDGKTGIRRVPVHVLLPKKVRVVAAIGGLLHSLALTAGGRVLAWGDNEGGQLGDGTMESHKLPAFVHIPRSVRIATLAAGRYFTLALTSTGKVWAWGDDSSGELGDGLNMARANKD
jgi:alpha-tubulin suppressor-like RCC1 family protein